MTTFAILIGASAFVTLLGMLGGWAWADARFRPRWRAREEERRRLRQANGNGNGEAPVVIPDLADAGNGAGAGLRRRIAELEQALAEARGRGAEADVLRVRVGELERAAQAAGGARPVSAVDVSDYVAQIAALEEELGRVRQRMAQMDAQQPHMAARIAELEKQTAAAGGEAGDGEEVARLQEELEAARGALAAAEARVSRLQAAPQPVSDDAATLLEWRNRYLNERVRYLEAQAPASPLAASPVAPSAEEAERENRLKWRLRYFEKRLAHVEAQAGAPGAAPEALTELETMKTARAETESALAAAKTRAEEEARKAEALAADLQAAQARLGDLETRLSEAQAQLAAGPSPELEHAVTRTRWKARYLEARVRYLEGKLAATPEAAPASPQLAPAPFAATPALQAVQPAPFRMERPAALSAPRGGAPDDLRLIEGVSAQTQAALNALGVFHFEQLAAWTPAQVAWVDAYLNLRGRIEAEQWITQAARLAREGAFAG
ncbi:MAG: hypothetical protein AB7M12_07115 [Hyphomonadaceae bacterium]